MSKALKTMTLPTIHLNGTSANDLAEGYRLALNAIDDACQALAGSGPNGRDYYPQGAGALEKALDEHSERLAALEKVKQEVLELARHCVDAAQERKSRRSNGGAA